MVTFNEGIRSPAILRAFGVQTSLLQSLALDVRVDGEIARSQRRRGVRRHGHVDGVGTDHPRARR